MFFYFFTAQLYIFTGYWFFFIFKHLFLVSNDCLCFTFKYSFSEGIVLFLERICCYFIDEYAQYYETSGMCSFARE